MDTQSHKNTIWKEIIAQMGWSSSCGCAVSNSLVPYDLILTYDSIRQLNERINAIDELLTTDNPMKPTLEDLLKHMPDLEKGLSRIHYGLVSNVIIVI